MTGCHPQGDTISIIIIVNDPIDLTCSLVLVDVLVVYEISFLFYLVIHNFNCRAKGYYVSLNHKGKRE